MLVKTFTEWFMVNNIAIGIGSTFRLVTGVDTFPEEKIIINRTILVFTILRGTVRKVTDKIVFQ